MNGHLEGLRYYKICTHEWSPGRSTIIIFIKQQRYRSSEKYKFLLYFVNNNNKDRSLFIRNKLSSLKLNSVGWFLLFFF